MNRIATSIAARLSLRAPQTQSLDILATIADGLSLRKGADVAGELATVKSAFPTVESFERDFPSLCFALATGVGKTRLMGAFVAYLHAAKGIKHFFVLAPNLTIYNKLIADFTPNTPKYVLTGIPEFATTPPVLITGENYENQRVARRFSSASPTFSFEDAVHINIFNISKLNKDSSERQGTPRIKRLSEYIGQSYFEYLAGLDDLVLLMDESHRYRGDAGMRVLNELGPVLGLELTATPQIENGKNTTAFKNVAFAYPLSEALKDGFIKEPAVATREDFDATQYKDDEAGLERIKLEDAIRVHEEVKVDLSVYAQQNNTKVVKPFVLVIAQNVDHASELERVIKSHDFFGGQYAERVITVHSNQRGEEKDETVERLLKVEDPNEPTEIVIHVNMLKEGWDVTNLYTIVPLRAANSKTLIEQSIGRGLRLPFGKRTGVEALDRLTIIAHDRFSEIIDEANKQDSIIRKGIVIGKDIIHEGKKAVTIPSRLESDLFGTGTQVTDAHGVTAAMDDATTGIEAPIPQTLACRKAALEAVAAAGAVFSLAKELETPRGQAHVSGEALIKYRVANPNQPTLPALVAQLNIETNRVIATFVKRTIDIPRIVVIPSGEVTSGFHDFDLDVSAINYQPVEQAILIKHLRDSSIQHTLDIDLTAPDGVDPADYVLRGVTAYDDIDYITTSDLLYKLARQVVAKLNTYLTDADDVFNVVRYYQRPLAALIHAQMQPHFWQKATTYQAQVQRGFSMLSSETVGIPADQTSSDFRATLSERREIRNQLFGGFAKCLYLHCKFDSDPERRFAVCLEDDTAVLKWVKPAKGALRINIENDEQYAPDFIVETATAKFMVEIKRRDLLTQEAVVAKARAAVKWCEYASAHELSHGGKPWSYLLVADNLVEAGKSLHWYASHATKTA